MAFLAAIFEDISRFAINKFPARDLGFFLDHGFTTKEKEVSPIGLEIGGEHCNSVSLQPKGLWSIKVGYTFTRACRSHQMFAQALKIDCNAVAARWPAFRIPIRSQRGERHKIHNHAENHVLRGRLTNLRLE
jgi:hypothetical protein